MLHIALLNPEIPGNTGNIGRLVVGLSARLHLIHPLGFQTDEKAVRRGGIDHWRHVDVVEHADLEAFWSWLGDRRVHLFSAAGEAPFTRCTFADDDVLLFGRESVGLPDELIAERGAYHVPMTGPVRSLNLSNAVAVVAYEAARQLHPEVF
ncbi:MAG: tRNA (cytidine(34)-2'-O)-methyltransferase [Proteobacteria bacterium]|nr:tRNA (cytidine(34)-2'-O)-methyltransferase [Pseudomonadota bacterium]MCP4919150.1 tRNA (cytidine(34)-2'-O)-methyltransferase [Pseudomonadota bacterium]